MSFIRVGPLFYSWILPRQVQVENRLDRTSVSFRPRQSGRKSADLLLARTANHPANEPPHFRGGLQ